MKKCFLFIAKVVWRIIGIIAIVVLWIYLSYHLYAKNSPSQVTTKLIDGDVCLGHACIQQPKILEKYAQLTAQHITNFEKNKTTIWPIDVFSGKSVYLVSDDKQQARYINTDTATADPIDLSQVPEWNSLAWYPDEFRIIDTDNNMTLDSFVQVIHTEDLLNESYFKNYIYLGTYDKFLSYVHEWFHAFGQEEMTWVWLGVPYVGNRGTSDFFEHTDERITRASMIDYLQKAIIATGDQRDQFTAQSIAQYNHYITMSEEHKETAYLDKIEWTAFYVEILGSLMSTNPTIKSSEDLTKAIQMVYQYKLWLWVEVWAVDESYEIWAAASFLLDYYTTSEQWKKDIISNPDVLQIDILADYVTNNLPPVQYQAPSEEFNELVKSKITEYQNRWFNSKWFIRMFYYMIF